MTHLVPSLLTLFFLAIATGCSTLDQAMKIASIDKPTVKVSDTKITGISLEQATLEFTLDVSNPNPIPIKLAGFDYTLVVNEQQFLAGEQREGVRIKANQSSQVTVPLALKFADIVKLSKGLSDSTAVNYTIKTDALIDLPVLGVTRVPAEKTGQLPIPKLPKISLSAINIKNLNFSGADVEVGLKLDNPNVFGMDISDLGYDLIVNGQRWLQSQTNETISLTKNGSSQLKVPLHLSFLDIGRTLATLLTQLKPLDYQLEGNMNMDTSLPMLKNIAMPFKHSGTINPQRD